MFEKVSEKYIFLFLLLVTIPAFWALLVPGFYGASDEVHIAWLYEMYETLKLGQIPPRFVPDLSFNRGYPLFNFVFPFPYYLASLIHFIGFNLVDSVKAVFLLSLPISGYFMYRLLREYSNKTLSILGTLIYIYSPYRATDIYVRGAIGEVISFVFLPLVILSVVKLTQKHVSQKLYAWIGVGSLSIALLVLSHNITSYMFLPFVFLFGLIRVVTLKLNFKDTLYIMGAGILGLLVSIYFWLPALVESRLMVYSTVFNYWDHFPSLRQLFTPYFGYGASVPGPGDGMSFFMGSPNVFILIFSLVFIIFLFRKMKTDDKGVLIWSFTVVLISLFMMNHRSAYLWENIPYLPYFQFPWRFLTMITFATPLMVISLNYIKQRIGVYLIIALAATSFSYFKPQDFLGRTDDYFLAKYVPYPFARNEYYSHSEEYLRLPKAVAEKPMSSSGLHSLESSHFSVLESRVYRLGMEAELITDSDSTLSYGKYYFPGWTVMDNGKKILSYGSSPHGEVTFEIEGPGKHSIEIFFKETPFRLMLNLVSFFSVLISIYLLLRTRIYKKVLKLKI